MSSCESKGLGIESMSVLGCKVENAFQLWSWSRGRRGVEVGEGARPVLTVVAIIIVEHTFKVVVNGANRH